MTLILLFINVAGVTGHINESHKMAVWMKPKLTIRDIARMAGVSHTTVSRVLNNDPRVRPDTTKKILQVVEESGYRPDPLAQRFARKRSNLIGLMVSDIGNPFYAELARGIEDRALGRDYHVIFCSTDEIPERTERYTEIMRGIGIDGIIFASVRLHDEVVEKLIEDRLPLVMVNRKLRSEKGDYVVLDNQLGAYQLTQHLIDHGYRKIAIITGPSIFSTGVDRLKGYQQALKEKDIPVRDTFIFQVPFRRQEGYRAAKTLLSRDDRPEAIFGGNDYIALGVMDAAEELGIRIPEDVVLVGFDDTEYARRMKLTTVSQRKYEMGNLAVQILIDCIENKADGYTHRIVLEPRLIIRESCGEHPRGEWSEDGVPTEEKI